LVLIEPDKLEPRLRGKTLGERIRAVRNGAADLSLGEKLQYFTHRVIGKLNFEFAELQNTDNDLLRQLYRALTLGAKPTVANTNPLRSFGHDVDPIVRRVVTNLWKTAGASIGVDATPSAGRAGPKLDASSIRLGRLGALVE
jgi:hypothetical protein